MPNRFEGTMITLGDGSVVPYDAIVAQILSRYQNDQKNPSLAVKSAIQLGIPEEVYATFPGVNAAAIAEGQNLISSGAFASTAVNEVAKGGTNVGGHIFADPAPVGSAMYNSRIAAGLDAYGLPPEQVAALRAAGNYLEPPGATQAPAASPKQYTDAEVVNAIIGSRQQGFNDEQIIQGAQANFGLTADRINALIKTVPAQTAAPAAGLLSSAAASPAAAAAQGPAVKDAAGNIIGYQSSEGAPGAVRVQTGADRNGPIYSYVTPPTGQYTTQLQTGVDRAGNPIYSNQTVITPQAQQAQGQAAASTFTTPSWVANARQTIGTGVEPVYPTRTGRDGTAVQDTSQAPIGYRYDNGQSQYVYLDLAGKPTGTVENRGTGLLGNITDMGKTLAPIALAALGANYLPGLLGGAETGAASINQMVASGLAPGSVGAAGAASGLLTGDALAAAAGLSGTAATTLASTLSAGAGAGTPAATQAAINEAVAAGTFTPGNLAAVAASNGITTAELISALVANPAALAAAGGLVTAGSALSGLGAAGTGALSSLMGGGALDTSTLAMGNELAAGAGAGAGTLGGGILGTGALASLMGAGTSISDLAMGDALATGAGAGAGVLPTVGLTGALAGLMGSNVIDTASLNLGDALTTAAGAGAGTVGGTSLLDLISGAGSTVKDALTKAATGAVTGAGTGGNLLGSLLTGGAGIMANNSAVDAARIQADAITAAAKTAADAAKFKPVGVTTAFGKSNFGYDANGNLISAGYELTPELAAQRDAILKAAGSTGMDWMKNTQAAGQSLFNLGQGYVAKTPEQAAAEWMAAQQKVLQPAQDTAYARMQQQLANTGRGGLSIAQGTGMGAANPEAQAYYNALAQQNNQLAASAQAEGRAATTFGQGLMTGGLDLVSQGYNPYKTQFGTAQSVEQAGQNALDISSTLAGRSATAGANAANTIYQGGVGAAGVSAKANAQNPYADLLAGAAGNPTITDYLNKWITGV